MAEAARPQGVPPVRRGWEPASGGAEAGPSQRDASSSGAPLEPADTMARVSACVDTAPPLTIQPRAPTEANPNPLADLGSSALPGRGLATAHSATASPAVASALFTQGTASPRARKTSDQARKSSDPAFMTKPSAKKRQPVEDS